MTTEEERLAVIEKLPEGTYRDTKGIGWHGTVVSPTELEWLIAEVRRLTGRVEYLNDVNKTVYARGRAEERAAVVTYLRDEATRPTIGLADAKVKMLAAFSHYIKRKIERGEHVAEVKDAT